MLAKQYKYSMCSCLFALALPTTASEIGNDALQLSGFATLGSAFSDSEYHGYRKNVSSDQGVFSGNVDFKQHTLLGLQADWSASSSIDFVFQGVLRDLPKTSFDRLTTLAFLRYELNSNWTFRVGRTAPDLFLLTEYRDVDFSYIWATAPNEIYGIVPYKSIDGVDVTYSQRVFGGVFNSKFFTGSSAGEISTIEIIQETKIEDILGVSLSFDHFNWIVNGKYSQVKIANEAEVNKFLAESISNVPDFLWPNSQTFAQSLLMKGEEVSYLSVSGQYQWQSWLVSAELSQMNSPSDVIPRINSGYASISYRLNAHQFYTVFAFTDSNKYIFNEPGVNEDVLEELVDVTTKVMNFYAANQSTVSFGWRWDITNNIASSLQWNYTSVEAEGGTLWLNKIPHHDSEEKINTVLYTLSMVF